MTKDIENPNSDFYVLADEDALLSDPLTEEPALISLRPQSFAEYIGQANLKSNLEIAAGAARSRDEAMDHLLLFGPPGLGKTSMAKILALELSVGFKATSGPVIERAGDLAAMLTSLEPKSVLFIDEIHRLPKIVEEVLYSAMEDYEIDILIGQGPAAKSVKVPLKPFTLVGATTRSGLLTSPLRDRFGLSMRLEYYSADELQQIVLRSAKILQLQISSSAALIIAERSRGTPRIANKILKRVRDYAQHHGQSSIDEKNTASALKLLQIDSIGLTQMDRMLLRTIVEKFNYGPVGLDTLAAAISEERETVEDVYEPFLLQAGLLERTSRGRILTAYALEYLGIKPNPAAPKNLNLFGN